MSPLCSPIHSSLDAQPLAREVAHDGLDAWRAVPALGDQALEPSTRALAHEHEDVALPLGEQLLDEVPADEPCCARDEVAHTGAMLSRLGLGRGGVARGRGLDAGAGAAAALAAGEARRAR